MAGGATTRFVYDGAQAVIETDGGNSVTTYRLPGAGFVSGGSQYYEQESLQGSVLSTRDSSATLKSHTQYDAYGVEYLPWESAPGALGGQRFAGQRGYQNDGATGMRLLGARYYLPALGRFLTPDPVGHGGGLNLYAYCGDSPLLKVDPSGHQARNLSDPWFINHRGDPLGSYGRIPGSPIKYNIETWIGVANDIANPPLWLQFLEGMANSGITTPSANATVWYVNKVRPGGIMDFKQYVRPMSGEGFDARRQEAVDFGNFNAGVIGRALGFERGYIMWGGGMAARHTNGGTRPFTYPTYGDQPRDNFFVQMGMQWYDRRYGKGR